MANTVVLYLCSIILFYFNPVKGEFRLADHMVLSPISFGYKPFNGPDAWGEIFPQCILGQRQSPISLHVRESTPRDLPPLYWYSHVDPARLKLEILNLQHSAKITFSGPERQYPRLRGGPLKGDYIITEVHFHWRSEHELEGKHYDLEAHVIHYKAEYGSLEEAKKFSDGLAVVGILFKKSTTKNPALSALISALPRVEQPDTMSHVSPASLLWLWDMDLFSEYFTYGGSLTQPPCTENVIWIVASRTSHVGRSQLHAFRKLNGPDGPIITNSRPLQPRSDREVIFFSEKFSKKKQFTPTFVRLNLPHSNLKHFIAEKFNI